MDSIQAILLALIQGVTEFLPISSSAHLILPAALTDWPDQGLLFDVAVHLGSLVAVMLYFRRELAGFASSGVRFIHSGVRDEHFETLLHLIVATVPIVAVGVLVQSIANDALRSVEVIAAATIGFALPLWWADWRVDHATKPPRLTMLHRDALLIGLAQTLALIPGTSRSGVTITAALLLGFSRPAAARFSFLLSIPTIAGAALLTGVDAAASDEPRDWLNVGLGFAVAAVSAYAVVKAFVALVDRTGMTPYVVYRIALGVVLLAMI